MDKFKVALFAKKLSKNWSKLPIQEIYTKLLKEPIYQPLVERLTGKQIIDLVFLIKLSEKSSDLSSLYDKIISTLFSFSTVEVDGGEVYTTCDYCNGDGSVECNYCDGTGEVDCGTCDGYGEVDSEPCGDCRGGGKLRCIECNGRGYEQCGRCDGLGEVEKYGFVYIDQVFYVSIDKNIFDKLELIEPVEKIGEILSDEIKMSKLTLILYINSTDTDTLVSEPSAGDTYFVGLSKENEFIINLPKNRVEDYNIVEY